jgi:hypothetical protein
MTSDLLAKGRPVILSKPRAEVDKKRLNIKKYFIN